MEINYPAIAGDLRAIGDAISRIAREFEAMDAKAVMAGQTEMVTTDATVNTQQGGRPGIVIKDDAPAGATIETVRASLSALKLAGHREDAVELLRRYGAKKVSDLALEHYADLQSDAMDVARNYGINMEVY